MSDARAQQADFRRRQFAETPAVQAVWGAPQSPDGATPLPSSDPAAAAAADGVTVDVDDSAAADVSRVILHIDVDAFYAQAEELRDPSLRERPLAITQKCARDAAHLPPPQPLSRRRRLAPRPACQAGTWS